MKKKIDWISTIISIPVAVGEAYWDMFKQIGNVAKDLFEYIFPKKEVNSSEAKYVEGRTEFILMAETVSERVLLLSSDARKKFFTDVMAERTRQDAKWGNPQYNTFCEWSSFLGEECGEAQSELNELNFGYGDHDKMYEELIHTAAMCLAIIENFEVAEEVTRIRHMICPNNQGKSEGEEETM